MRSLLLSAQQPPTAGLDVQAMAGDPDAGGGERQAAGGQHQHEDVPQGPVLQQRQPVPAVQQGKEPAFGALVAVQFRTWPVAGSMCSQVWLGSS